MWSSAFASRSNFGGRDSDTRADPSCVHEVRKKCSFSSSMTICPYSLSVLAPDVQRKRCRTPENPSVESRHGRWRSVGLLLLRRRSGACRWPEPPPPVSEAWSQAPATSPRRVVSPTERPTCRRCFVTLPRGLASPCRPCCLLSASDPAKPRSWAPTGNLAVRRLPKRSWDRRRACFASSSRPPFMGDGITVRVALSRGFHGVELNKEFCQCNVDEGL